MTNRRVPGWREDKARLERAFPFLEAAAEYADVPPTVWRNWEAGSEPLPSYRRKLALACERLDNEHRAGAEALLYSKQLCQTLRKLDPPDRICEVIERSEPIIDKLADRLLCPPEA